MLAQGECEPQGLAQEQCRACCRVSPAAFLMHHCDVPFRAVQPQQPQMFGEELPDMREGERPGPARRKRQPSMSETMPLYTLCREDLESMDKEVRGRGHGAETALPGVPVITRASWLDGTQQLYPALASEGTQPARPGHWPWCQPTSPHPGPHGLVWRGFPSLW